MHCALPCCTQLSIPLVNWKILMLDNLPNKLENKCFTFLALVGCRKCIIIRTIHPNAIFMFIQTLSILLGIQFRQRYRQIKDRRPIIFLNIFVLAWPWDPRGPGTYSKFVQSPLMIELWNEECQSLMIFPYFSWKYRRSPAQD